MGNCCICNRSSTEDTTVVVLNKKASRESTLDNADSKDLNPPTPATAQPATSNFRSLASTPKLPELLSFKTSSGSTIKIVHEIGTHYSKLGPLLLNDDRGATASAIVSQFQRDAAMINQEILTQWLQGQGKKPVTWSTLIDVLKDIGLSELARMIQESLTTTEISSTQISEPQPESGHPPQPENETTACSTQPDQFTEMKGSSTASSHLQLITPTSDTHAEASSTGQFFEQEENKQQLLEESASESLQTIPMASGGSLEEASQQKETIIPSPGSSQPAPERSLEEVSWQKETQTQLIKLSSLPPLLKPAPGRCEDLADVLETIHLDTYIAKTIAEFESQTQEGNTSYANAIATVFHLSMCRIVGRGVIPSFYEIRKRIIDEYGDKGASTKSVLRRFCPEYRLHFKKVNETGARQAINRRRPVVAVFFLYEEEWTKFSDFYRKTPKGILKKSDLIGGNCEHPGEHVVVLMECAPNALTFMNSWGQDFADGGRFRVENQSVLNDTKFYDIYWTLRDLKQSELEGFKEEGTKRVQELLQKFPSIQDLPYECPMCNQKSKVGEFSGHILEAECPKCHQKFKPTFLQSLHTQTHTL